MQSKIGTPSLTLEHLPFRDAEGYVLPMIQANSLEIMDRPANPDLITMRCMCEAGMLRVYVLFKDQEPIGYCLMAISNNLLWQDIKQAVQLVVYVKPEHRGRAGAWMIAEVDKDLRQFVDRIYRHSRDARVGLFRKFGYKIDEATYLLET